MLSFLLKENLCRFAFIVCLYIYCRWREWRVENIITSLCYSQSTIWMSDAICRGSFVFSDFSSKELFFLLILMELWTITVGALFSLYKHTFHDTGQTGCQVIRGLVTTTIAYACCPPWMIPSQFIPGIVIITMIVHSLF